MLFIICKINANYVHNEDMYDSIPFPQKCVPPTDLVGS